MKAIEVREPHQTIRRLGGGRSDQLFGADGEFFGFLDSDGAGKTTTVRMLTGVIRPDAGQARVGGYDVVREPLRVKQLLGVVPEMANVYIESLDFRSRSSRFLSGSALGCPCSIPLSLA